MNRSHSLRAGIFGFVFFCAGVAGIHSVLGDIRPTEVERYGLRYAIWIFLDAHNVGLVEAASHSGSTEIVSSFSITERSEITEIAAFSSLFAPMVAAAAGFVYASRERSRKLTSALFDGASIAIGYIVAVAIAVLYAREEASALGIQGILMLDIVDALLFAALGYPIVFGGIGGLLYFITSGKLKISVKQDY